MRPEGLTSTNKGVDNHLSTHTSYSSARKYSGAAVCLGSFKLGPKLGIQAAPIQHAAELLDSKTWTKPCLSQ